MKARRPSPPRVPRAKRLSRDELQLLETFRDLPSHEAALLLKVAAALLRATAF